MCRWMVGFQTKLNRFKIRLVLSPFPDDVDVMLTAIFNFIGRQRNDLGHPRSTPPKTTREECFANLIIFSEYYKTLTEVVAYLNTNHF